MSRRRTQRPQSRNKKRRTSLISKRSNPKNPLPQFVVRAHAAVKAGRVEEATRLFKENAAKVTQELTGQKTPNANVTFVLAEVLYLNKQYKMAEDLCKRILKQRPNALSYKFALVYNMLAGICRNTGRIFEAIEYLRKTTQIAPHFAGAWSNLAMLLIRIGEIQQGVNLLRKAVQNAPDNPTLHSNLLLYLNYLPDVDEQEVFDEHKRWAGVHAPASLAGTSHSNTPEPGRKLRVGYISSDFRMHPVANFFEPLIDEHNRKVVQVYGYGNVKCPDKTTERLKHKFDHYRNICGVSDEAAANIIERDQIDILVDLTGHTDSNRLRVLAYKPAPIQVTYLGYSNTTAMRTVDYRLTDRLANPPQSQKFYTEELICLPGSFSCYRPADFAPPVAPLPAIRNGYVTFGSSNNSCKIHPFLIGLWAEILKATDNSHILLRFRGGNDHRMKERYFRHFEQLGIHRERVEICGWKNIVEYLQEYSRVDIALDTFPWNGHTTTCEALWMGVPTISLAGRPFVSRVGLSILNSVGLESFVASRPQGYVAKAVWLAENLETLAKLRPSLRGRMAASMLCNARAFARNIESAYRKIWHKWCRHSNTI